MSAARGRFVAITLLLALAACGEGEGARVEELLDSGAAVLPVELTAVDGLRDGDLTRARLDFRGGTATHLRLDLGVAYDPQPVLRDGSWRYEGPTGRAQGTVEAEHVRFIGGQGDGAQIGGVFLLVEAGRRRFRVRLPLTEVQTRAWKAGD